MQGGSTLAQQYVKNALILTAVNSAGQQAAIADSAARKIRELRIAVNVEHALTPDQLLAAYLNVAYFENEAYGIEVAAERYFGRTAAGLSLPESALLAGLVQNPALYDPLTDPAGARQRRNVVLTRMTQLHDISAATAAAAERTPLDVHFRPQSVQQGCTSASASISAWFCDYTIAELQSNPVYKHAWQLMNSFGGLKIYTTMNPQDQDAAQNSVNFMLPAPPSGYNPGRNAAAEVLIQPGTGAIQAIAVDRPYGTGRGQDSIDYAADTAQHGGIGVQTGSSSKLFTLIAALKRGTPFGFSMAATSPSDIGPYYNCAGQPTGMFPVSNAEGAGHGVYTLYTGTTQSINVFFAELEKRVGLCSTVKTAVSMGDHRADGTSLLRAVGKPGRPGYELPADDIPSFTLGSVAVSPMTMADAYATVAAGGIYCRPVAISRITATGGRTAAGRARGLPPRVPGGSGGGRHLHPARRPDQRHRPGRRRDQGRHLRAAGGQDGNGQQLRLRGIRRLHAETGRLCVDVQPVRARHSPDDRICLLLPRSRRRPGLPGLGLRRQRGPDLAAHLRVR